MSPYRNIALRLIQGGPPSYPLTSLVSKGSEGLWGPWGRRERGKGHLVRHPGGASRPAHPGGASRPASIAVIRRYRFPHSLHDERPMGPESVIYNTISLCSLTHHGEDAETNEETARPTALRPAAADCLYVLQPCPSAWMRENRVTASDTHQNPWQPCVHSS